MPKKKALRFPPNPEAGWGPKRRAGRPPVKSKDSAVSNVENEVSESAGEQAMQSDQSPIKRSRND